MEVEVKEMRQYKGMTLPMDYEKELKIAQDKLVFHQEQMDYHTACAIAMEEMVEDLIPFTNYYERAEERAKQNRASSKEITEIRKKVKKEKAKVLVDIMLERIKNL